MKKNVDIYVHRITRNFLPALAIAIVMVPVALALAIASHAIPITGIIACIWAGLIGALFCSSNYTIFGPTSAVTGFLASYATMHYACDLALIAIIAGITIIAIYVAKLEKHIALIPTSAVHGFTLGTAIILIGGQINFALGLVNVPKHQRFLSNVLESVQHLGAYDLWTILLFLSSLLVLYLSIVIIPRVPSVIILSLYGVIVGFLSRTYFALASLQTIGTSFGDIEGKIFERIYICCNPEMVMTGIVVGIVALLETLIAARVADRLTKTTHDRRRETLTLGLANVASGLFGGIPVATPVGRVVYCIEFGMTDRIAQAINAIFLILFAIVLLPYFSYLPLAVIAAMMVYFCIRMIEREEFKRLYHHERINFWISMIVALICIVENPIMGLLAGATLGFIFKINTKEPI